MMIQRIVSGVSVLLLLVGCTPVGGPNSWIPKTIASFQGGSETPGWGAFFQDWETRKRLIKVLQKNLPALAKKVDIYVMDQKILIVGVIETHEQRRKL